MPVDELFKELSPYESLSFISNETSLRNPDEICRIYDSLLNEDISSESSIEEWITKRSELEAALSQERSILFIEMTCDTSSEEKSKAYKNFIETVVPVIKKYSHKLDLKYMENKSLHSDSLRYQLYLRKKEANVRLFREKNIPLLTEEALLSQKYQSVCGAMTVFIEGKELTLQQAQKLIEEPDRMLREKTWKAVFARRLEDKESMDQIFNQMKVLRHKIAVNAGFKNYIEYKFLDYERFDYTPEDCYRFHETVEKVVVPLVNSLLLERKNAMKLSDFRPWDLTADAFGRPPLKPFQNVFELTDGVSRIMESLDKELGKQFKMIRESGFLDLESRKGKAPGGYQSTLSLTRKPFIFMNAVGTDQNVRTLLHESGHAFHVLAAAHEPLLEYRDPPIEFCEVASMSMELFGNDFLGAFYSEEDQRRSVRNHLEDIVCILPWIALIDAFQHWIYRHPDHTTEERTKTWIELRNRFSGDLVDWNGLEEEQAALWQRQLHIFEYPFYYIEYGIAQLGALQMWQNYRKDSKSAVNNYKKGLSFGGALPLPELYQESGIRFDFSEKMVTSLIKDVEKELEKLGS